MPHPFPHFEPPELAHRDVWLAQKELGTPFGSVASILLLQTLPCCACGGAAPGAHGRSHGAPLEPSSLCQPYSPALTPRSMLMQGKPAVLLPQR